ncbi:MAG: two-component system phosphate regulon sensor histidine kinase PhoR [Planctomycetota bacterium]|jgi:two-component system phosphate regulon sensor histidine kinase PhoR
MRPWKRRRIERVRRDFVSKVSHEFKTPLTSIRGYVETLIDGAIDDQRNNRRFLIKIEDNVKRLNHLVSDLLRIFKRFYRVDKARSRAVVGTGLGLSNVKHMVSAMNGSITVLSESGPGTRFVVLLPRA